MSIVNDALKKIEKKRDTTNSKPSPQAIEEQKDEQPAVQTPPTVLKEPPQRKKKRFYPLKILIALGIVLAAVFFIKSFSDRFINPISPDSASSRSERVTPFGQTVKTTIPPAKERSKTSPLNRLFKPMTRGAQFQLSGIMFSESNPVAIINNEIVREGGLIEGAIVESIQENRVKLSYGGQELILKVQ